MALHQHNISCKIFDLRDKAAFDGGFVALAPNALRALSRIGVYDRLSKQGWNYEEFQFLSSRNLSHIGTVMNGSQKRYGYKALRISRGIVRQTLVQALRERGIELHYNSRCVDIKETAHSSVIATFADGRIEEADFLIGADGIHSHVRAHLEPNAIATFSGQLGVGGSLPKSQLPSSGQSVYMPCLVLGKLNSFMFM
jgi:2-polyprenyl-6-methoxyphenol hydroxylase-like FAD-dependent oxidoreductase